MQMNGCIFCKIINGEIPCVELYRDEYVMAFLDIAPINKGHVLVIPLEHHASPATLPEVVAGRLFKVGARFGIAIKRALNADGYNLHLADGTAAGQVVMHMHLHVVPRYTEDEFHFNWRQKAYDSDDERTAYKAKLLEKFSLKD